MSIHLRRSVRPGYRHAFGLVLVAAVLGGCAAEEETAGGPPINVPSAPRPVTVEWAGELCSAFRPTFEALEAVTPVTAPGDREAVLGDLAVVDAAVRRTTTALPLVGAAPVEEGQPVIERVGARFDEFRTALDQAIASLREPDTADPPQAAAVLDTFTRAEVVSALRPPDEVQEALAFAPACAAYR